MNLTPEERAAAARARMVELADKFVERTRGELVTLREQFAALGRGDVAVLGQIAHLSHRMTGTGATLGFEALSEHAHRVEMLAEQVGSSVIPDAATLAQLGAAIESLSNEAERLSSR